MTEQITTEENIFTLKIKTLLTQRILSLANTETVDVDQMYDRLQQENRRLQN